MTIRAFGCFAVLTFAVAGLSLSPAHSAGPDPAEGKRERLVARYLEAGRTAEALVEAEGGAKTFPESGVIRRRLAQARLCEALRIDRELSSTSRGVGMDYWLSDTETEWRNPDRAAQRTSNDPQAEQRFGPDRRRAAAMRQAQQLLTPENEARIREFHNQVKAQVDAAPGLLERRGRLLSQAIGELKEAAQRGDASGERALTELWARTAILIGAQRATQAGYLIQGEAKRALPGADQVTPRLQAWQATLQAAGEKKPKDSAEAVLRAAAETAHRFPDDPTVLAGAGDVLSFVAALARRPDPIREHAGALRNHRFILGAARFNGGRPREKVEQARAAFKTATDLQAPEPDPVQAPGSLALRLYRRALAKDAMYRLPYLRTALYHLEVGFDREAADQVLDQAIHREPRNAVPVLESAVTAYAADEQLPAGMNQIREAVRAAEFSRSVFVAMPAPLRPAFKFLPDLDAPLSGRWLSLGGMFTTIEDIQRSAGAPDIRMDLRLLRLKLADLLCRAPDQQDQALGIDAKARVLRELIGLTDDVTPDQKRQYERALVEHHQRYSSYPKLYMTLEVGPNGVRVWGYPETDTADSNVKGRG